MKLERDTPITIDESGISFAGDKTRALNTQLAAFPVDTSLVIDSFLQRYARSKRAIPVSFRKLVPWLKVGERATHYLHPYPAKLLPHIAHFFLASESMCKREGLVLDPFGGSGTVALETRLSGRRAAYADTNPLARLIAETKTCIPKNTKFGTALEELEVRFKQSRTRQHPAVVNIEKWFTPPVIRNLSRLRAAIESEPKLETRRLFQVTFSATVRRVSNADLRISVPVLAKGPATLKSAEDVWSRFNDQFLANVSRINELTRLAPDRRKIEMVGPDARQIATGKKGALEPGSVDLIITSPPYAGAQKYIRASSLCLGWLGLAEEGELRPLETLTIGREHLTKANVEDCALTSIPAANRVIARVRKKNPMRAAICATYLNEMEEVMKQLQIALKPGGRFVLVIGNNEVCGEKFLSSEYLCSMLERLGLKLQLKLVDEIKSRGLMTRRNRNASVITREWVLVFKK